MSSLVKTKGFDQLLRKFVNLPRKGARRANRAATRAGPAILLRAVKNAVPVDKGILKRQQTSKITGRGYRLTGFVGADVAQLEADEKRPTNIDWLVEQGHTTPGGTFVPPSGVVLQRSLCAGSAQWMRGQSHDWQRASTAASRTISCLKQAMSCQWLASMPTESPSVRTSRHPEGQPASSATSAKRPTRALAVALIAYPAGRARKARPKAPGAIPRSGCQRHHRRVHLPAEWQLVARTKV